MKNTKILNIFVGLIMLLGLIFWIRTTMTSEESLTTNASLQASILNPFTYLTYALVTIAALVAIGFSMVSIVSNSEALKKTLIGLGAMIVILVAAYLIAPDNVINNLKGDEIASATVSKWVSTGIWYSVILGGLGLLSFVVDFAKSLVK